MTSQPRESLADHARRWAASYRRRQAARQARQSAHARMAALDAPAATAAPGPTRRELRQARKINRCHDRQARDAARPRSPRDLPRSLHYARRGALAAIALVVTAATATSLAESFRGLYEWADRHGLPHSWALAFPLMIDSFLLVGELALFVALVDGWPRSARRWPWVVTLTGLAVSVAGNVGHIATSILADRATAAVPPLAAAAGLTVGLGVLKRVVDHYGPARPAPDPAEWPELAELTGPEVNTWDGSDAAAIERDHLTALGAADSDASRIRYARQVTGERTPGAVAGWLAARGFPVSEVNVATVIRRQDASRERVTYLPGAAPGDQ